MRSVDFSLAFHHRRDTTRNKVRENDKEMSRVYVRDMHVPYSYYNHTLYLHFTILRVLNFTEIEMTSFIGVFGGSSFPDQNFVAIQTPNSKLGCVGRIVL